RAQRFFITPTPYYSPRGGVRSEPIACHLPEEPLMRLRSLRLVVSSVVVAGLLLGALPAPVDAQTPYVPYFGKNRVRYDRFTWYTYTTDHFEIFYYPEIEVHLERVASYAESAYQHVSAALKH